MRAHEAKSDAITPYKEYDFKVQHSKDDSTAMLMHCQAGHVWLKSAAIVCMQKERSRELCWCSTATSQYIAGTDLKVLRTRVGERFHSKIGLSVGRSVAIPGV